MAKGKPTTPSKKGGPPTSKAKAKTAAAGQTRLEAFFGGSPTAASSASPVNNRPAKKPVEVVDLSDDEDSDDALEEPPMKRAKLEDEKGPEGLEDEEDVQVGTGDSTKEEGTSEAFKDVKAAQEESKEVTMISLSPPKEAVGPSKPQTPFFSAKPIPTSPSTNAGSSSSQVLSLKQSSNDLPPTKVTTKIFSYDPSELPSDWATDSSSPPYSFAATAFAAVDHEKGRIAIVDAMTNAFRSVLKHCPADVLPLLYLSSNSIAPSYEGVELGVGGQVMSRAIKEITGATSTTLRSLYQKHGDLGDVAMELRVKQRTLFTPKPLTVGGVYKTLRRIASLSGSGTVEEKVSLVKNMLIAARGEEIRYLVRTLIANIRIGATKTTSLIALSHAVVMKNLWDDVDKTQRTSKLQEQIKEKMKAAEAAVKEVYARVPSYDVIVAKLLDPEVGIDKLAESCSCTPGVPIKGMLGKITRDLAEALTKIEGHPFVADYKYDGMRAQIHRSEDGTYSVFSRHLENVTQRYPDVLAVLPLAAKESTTSFILDAEVVAWDPLQHHILPFQQLTNRPRKAVKLEDLKDNHCKVYVFDMMFLNGESLLKKPLRERLTLLESAFDEVPERFAPVKRLYSTAHPDNADTISEFLSSALEEGAEGLMIKLLDNPAVQGKGTIVATYEADKRTDSWLKVKQDYAESFRTFDLVVMGAWWGNGRKKGWYSPFLLGCWNQETQEVEAVCKIISGFSDAFYKQQLEVFSEESGLISPEKKSYYVTDYDCSLWFEPQVVWEVRGADLTLSPTHPAAKGLVSEDRGISMRFPRFVRVREDKGMEEATTSEEIADAYSKQVTVSNRDKSRAGNGGGGGKDGEAAGGNDDEEENDGDAGSDKEHGDGGREDVEL